MYEEDIRITDAPEQKGWITLPKCMRHRNLHQPSRASDAQA